MQQLSNKRLKQGIELKALFSFGAVYGFF